MKRGRPPKAQAGQKYDRIQVRFEDGTFDRIEKALDGANEDYHDFIRAAVELLLKKREQGN